MFRIKAFKEIFAVMFPNSNLHLCLLCLALQTCLPHSPELQPGWAGKQPLFQGMISGVLCSQEILCWLYQLGKEVPLLAGDTFV